MTNPAEVYRLRDATAADLTPIMQLLSLAFATNVNEDRSTIEGYVFEPTRSHVVEHGGEIVGHALAYTRELTVPGAVLAAAHVSFVAVAPTHRRRGLLTRLMAHQLSTVPEPIAALWASESTIYQRYGYGMTGNSVSFTMATREVRLRTPAVGGVRAGSLSDSRKDMQHVYERVRASTPGRSGRDEHWWDVILSDAESRRSGATPKRVALADGPDGVDGYVIWRTKLAWNALGGPDAEAEALELVAATPEAYARLWQFLLTLDLVRTLSHDGGNAEEPIQYLVDEPRQLGGRCADGLWLRLVDLPTALTARRYAGPVDVVIEVTDALLPANSGRFRLTADPASPARCIPAPDLEPALACDTADLAAAYLGGTSLSQLALAGRVRELQPGTLLPTATAFGWPVAPAPIEIF